MLQAGARYGHAFSNRADVSGYGPLRSQPNPEDYRQTNVLLKLQQRWEGDHKLGLTAESFQRHGKIDNKGQQGPGSVYAYDNNSTTQAAKRERLSLDYAYLSASPAQTGVSSARAMLYWQRVRLADAMDGWRMPDARALNIEHDPFRYGFHLSIGDH